MIDPYDVTNYKYSNAQLEEFILFCVSVAGKTAYIISEKVDQFLKLEKGYTPFSKIRKMIINRTLDKNLRKVKLGKYSTLNRGFAELALSGIDLRTCTVEDLEQFTGISHKTSRYFLLHSRKNPGNIACIDRHVKLWLNERGYTSNKYHELEKAFLEEVAKTDKTVAQLDLEIWNEFAKRKRV